MKSLWTSSAFVVGVLRWVETEAAVPLQDAQQLEESSLVENEALAEASSVAPAISTRGDIRGKGVSVVQVANFFSLLAVIFLLMQCLHALRAKILDRKAGRRLAVGGQDPCDGDGVSGSHGGEEGRKKYQEMNENEKQHLVNLIESRKIYLENSNLLETARGRWVHVHPGALREVCTRVEVDGEGLMTGFSTTCFFDYMKDEVSVVRKFHNNVLLRLTSHLGGVRLGGSSAEEIEQSAREFLSRLEELDTWASSFTETSKGDGVAETPKEGGEERRGSSTGTGEDGAEGGESDDHSSHSEGEEVQTVEEGDVLGPVPSGPEPKSPMPRSDLGHRRASLIMFKFPSVDSTGSAEETEKGPDGEAAPQPSPGVARWSSDKWQITVDETVSHPLTGEAVRMREWVEKYSDGYKVEWKMTDGAVERLLTHVITKKAVEYFASTGVVSLGDQSVVRFVRHSDGEEEVRITSSSGQTLTSTEIVLGRKTTTILVKTAGKEVVKATVDRKNKLKCHGCSSDLQKEELLWQVEDSRRQAQALKAEFEALATLIKDHGGTPAAPSIKTDTPPLERGKGLKWDTHATTSIHVLREEFPWEVQQQKNELTGMQRTIWSQSDGSRIISIPMTPTECSVTSGVFTDPATNSKTSMKITKWLPSTQISQKETKDGFSSSATLDMLDGRQNKRLVLEERRSDSEGPTQRTVVYVTKKGEYKATSSSVSSTDAEKKIQELLENKTLLERRAGLLSTRTHEALHPSPSPETHSAPEGSAPEHEEAGASGESSSLHLEGAAASGEEPRSPPHGREGRSRERPRSQTLERVKKFFRQSSRSSPRRDDDDHH